MAKSKNHTAHNQTRKWHRNGIKRQQISPRRNQSKKGVYMPLRRQSKLCKQWDPYFNLARKGRSKEQIAQAVEKRKKFLQELREKQA